MVLNEDSWRDHLQQLKAFHQKYGHCNVLSRKKKHAKLYHWVKQVQDLHKLGEQEKKIGLTNERIDELNDLQFDWGSKPLWLTRLQELREFRKFKGHCFVPHQYPSNPLLGRWVWELQREFQRSEKERKSSYITTELVAELNVIGFDWIARAKPFNAEEAERWRKHMCELREFSHAYGHCNVPYRYPTNPSLGKWVLNLRTEYKRKQNRKESSLTAELIAELDALGFLWLRLGVVRGDDETWKNYVHKLQEFRKVYGHCRVSNRYQDPSLAKWVAAMRQEYKKKQKGEHSWLTLERIDELDDLGFVWGEWCHHGYFQSTSSELAANQGHSHQHKHREVAPTLQSKNVLEKECKDVGVWQRPWNKCTRQLIEFRRVHGHCCVTRRDPKNAFLAGWVTRQRLELRKKLNGERSSLTLEKIKLLNDVGFVWDGRISMRINKVWNNKILRPSQNVSGQGNMGTDIEQRRLSGQLSRHILQPGTQQIALGGQLPFHILQQNARFAYLQGTKATYCHTMLDQLIRHRDAGIQQSIRGRLLPRDIAGIYNAQSKDLKRHGIDIQQSTRSGLLPYHISEQRARSATVEDSAES